MPAPVSAATPMTYSVDGRQYIIVGVSGGNYTGEYISFRAARRARDTTTQQGR